MGGEGRRVGRRAGPCVPAGGTLWRRRSAIILDERRKTLLARDMPCGWSRECISRWAAESVAELQPKDEHAAGAD